MAQETRETVKRIQTKQKTQIEVNECSLCGISLYTTPSDAGPRNPACICLGDPVGSNPSSNTQSDHGNSYSDVVTSIVGEKQKVYIGMIMPEGKICGGCGSLVEAIQECQQKLSLLTKKISCFIDEQIELYSLNLAGPRENSSRQSDTLKEGGNHWALTLVNEKEVGMDITSDGYKKQERLHERTGKCDESPPPSPTFTHTLVLEPEQSCTESTDLEIYSPAEGEGTSQSPGNEDLSGCDKISREKFSRISDKAGQRWSFVGDKEKNQDQQFSRREEPFEREPVFKSVDFVIGPETWNSFFDISDDGRSEIANLHGHESFSRIVQEFFSSCSLQIYQKSDHVIIPHNSSVITDFEILRGKCLVGGCSLSFHLSLAHNFSILLKYSGEICDSRESQETKIQKKICDYCLREMDPESDVIGHLRSQHQDQVYSCPCGTQFLQRERRNSHRESCIRGVPWSSEAELVLGANTDLVLGGEGELVLEAGAGLILGESCEGDEDEQQEEDQEKNTVNELDEEDCSEKMDGGMCPESAEEINAGVCEEGEKERDPVNCPVELNLEDEDCPVPSVHPKEDNNEFSCTDCGLEFDVLSDLKRHVLTHPVSKAVRCPNCSKVFSNPRNLQVHTQVFHCLETMASRYNFPCPTCKKVFYKKSNLDSHLLSHSDLKPFQCSLCDKQFKRQVALNKHVENIHGDEDRKTFLCGLCGLSFKTQTGLRLHRDSQHENSPHLKPFSCLSCDKRFRCKADLTEHTVVHTKEKRFKCDICGMGYTRKNSLVDHLKVHSATYKCDKCGKCFGRSVRLEDHSRVCQKKVVVPPLPLPLQQEDKVSVSAPLIEDFEGRSLALLKSEGGLSVYKLVGTREPSDQRRLSESSGLVEFASSAKPDSLQVTRRANTTPGQFYQETLTTTEMNTGRNRTTGQIVVKNSPIEIGEKSGDYPAITGNSGGMVRVYRGVGLHTGVTLQTPLQLRNLPVDSCGGERDAGDNIIWDDVITSTEIVTVEEEERGRNKSAIVGGGNSTNSFSCLLPGQNKQQGAEADSGMKIIFGNIINKEAKLDGNNVQLVRDLDGNLQIIKNGVMLHLLPK